MNINIEEYGFVRVASVSPEMRIADIDFNTEKIIEACLEAKKNSCNLILFPELALSGYTCADLFYQSSLINACYSSFKKLIDFSLAHSLTIIVGSPIMANNRLFNCAIVFSNGKIIGIVPKTYLPNNNEYYEERWFSSEFDRTTESVSIFDEEIPFGANLIFECSDIEGLKFGLEICEDLWAINPPSANLAAEAASVLFNLSASDEFLGKSQYRKNLVINQSARCIAAYVYSSAGPNESTTDVLFSGHCLIAENGNLLAENNRFDFNTNIIYADIDLEKLNSERLKNNSFSATKPNNKYRYIKFNIKNSPSDKFLRTYSKTPFVPSDINQRDENCSEIMNIQSTALAKRMKHIGITEVVLGLSGGLDSTLALLVCLRAFDKLQLDRKGIHTIIMPGFGTSNRTRTNAISLAEHSGTTMQIIDISDSVNLHFKDINHSPDNHNVVYENAQARERTQILMDISNQVNGIVIGTGDLSEIALGWSTYNADHMSMYAVNSGVPKTLVAYIVDWYAKHSGESEIKDILLDIIDTPISPELLPLDSNNQIQQKTESSIGPYKLHDFFLYHFVRFNYTPKKLYFMAMHTFKDEFTAEEIMNCLQVFIKRFFFNQYKRSCIPDGIKVGSVALSPRGDWRMPSDASPNIWLKNLNLM